MLWNDAINLQVISFSTHHLLFRVSGDGNKGEWIVSGMYGWLENNAREQTWQLLSTIRRPAHEVRLCMGDFNEIMWSYEKTGDNQRPWKCMELFRNVARYCSLSDLGFSGSMFTWCNNRKGDQNIKEKLDRFLANDSWKSMYPSARVKHYRMYK